VIKKFGLTEKEFNGIMNLPKKSYWDYSSYGHVYKSWVYQGVRSVYHAVKGQPYQGSNLER